MTYSLVDELEGDRTGKPVENQVDELAEDVLCWCVRSIKQVNEYIVQMAMHTVLVSIYSKLYKKAHLSVQTSEHQGGA